MKGETPDRLVFNETWSDLRQYRPLPVVDFDRLYAWRTSRLREQMRLNDIAALVCDPEEIAGIAARGERLLSLAGQD